MPNISDSMGANVGAMMLGALAEEMGRAIGGPSNFSSMQMLFGLMAGGSFQPSGPGFSASMPASGQANIDLGDGNTLRINEANSEVDIVDAQGNVTSVSGDPHVYVNGQHVGDFYAGNTTFQLQDGTKVTIGTQESTSNPGVYYANQVTVTRGDNAVQINGLSQQQQGDMTVSVNQNGRALDAMTSDGLVLNQAAGGAGWTSSLTGKAVTQSDFDMTKRENAGALQFGEALSSAMTSFLTFGALGQIMALAEQSAPQPQSLAKAMPLFNLAEMMGQAAARA